MLSLKFEITKLFVDLFIVFCVREGPPHLTPNLILVYIVLMLVQVVIHLAMLCLQFLIAQLFVDLFIADLN